MSKTISFVASDQLADFLEEESNRRMTTVSSTAQMLLAEKVKEIDGAEADKSDSDGSEDDVFDHFPDKWYRPSGKYSYAVRTAEGEETKYYKTRNGAAKRLTQEYERRS